MQQSQQQMKGGQQRISGLMVVVSLANGMIGSLLLLLPLMASSSGYLLTCLIIAVIGGFNFYSCYLTLAHTKYEPDLDSVLLHHFNRSKVVKSLYDLIVWVAVVISNITYFKLITIQWEGLIGGSINNTINILSNAAAVLVLAYVMKFFRFGAALMGYGILSIVAYLIFLIWASSSQDTSAEESNPYVPFGSGGLGITAAINGGFGIQSFFIPVLKKNDRPGRYVWYLLCSYAVGSIVYFYIACLGSYSIRYRPCSQGDCSDGTIESYFKHGQWPVHVIEAIYLIHLYTVIPQFILVGKKRLFSLLSLEESQQRGIKASEVVYILVTVAVCMVVTLFNVSLRFLIDFNGAFSNFFFMYLIPIALHIKCLYFSPNKHRPGSEQTLPLSGIQEDPYSFECDCQIQEMSRPARIRMFIMLGLTLAFGGYIFAYGVIQMVS